MKHQLQERPLSSSLPEEIDQLYQQKEDSFEEYIDQLLWWNERINLVSRNVSRETIQGHIKHSLTLSALSAFSEASAIIDTGTGGGLPGVPLLIAFPEKEMLFNDIVSKKIVAVKQIVYKLNLSHAEYFSSSLEKLSFIERPLIVTKHAFKINDLYNMIRGKEWNSVLMLKGYGEVVEELEGIKDTLSIDIYKLDTVFKETFYSGKGIVEIKRVANE